MLVAQIPNSIFEARNVWQTCGSSTCQDGFCVVVVAAPPATSGLGVWQLNVGAVAGVAHRRGTWGFGGVAAGPATWLWEIWKLQLPRAFGGRQDQRFA